MKDNKPTDLDVAKVNDLAINATEDDAASLDAVEDDAATLEEEECTEEDSARRYYLNIYRVSFMC